MEVSRQQQRVADAAVKLAAMPAKKRRWLVAQARAATEVIRETCESLGVTLTPRRLQTMTNETLVDLALEEKVQAAQPAEDAHAPHPPTP